MALNTLAQIRSKIRRLTRSVSQNQITDAQIDEYIDTFVLYDFPAQIKLDYLMSTLTFYTKPGIDVYATNAIVGDPLEDFKNRYISVSNPVYISGCRSYFTQSRDEFYRMFPLYLRTYNESLSNLTPNYAGVLSFVPVLRNTITFSMVDANGIGYVVHDDGAGLLVGDGNGNINYTTGAYVVNFIAVPAAGTYVKSNTYSYTAGQPGAVLFYDTEFTLRPVPDGSYPVTMNCMLRPTSLLNAGSHPDLDEWSQYIAFGASKKIYEDRMDMDSAQALMVPLQEQEDMCLRRTLKQHQDLRSQSLYKGVGSYGYHWWNNWF